MNKNLMKIMAIACTAGMLVACSPTEVSSEAKGKNDNEITVISREESSGTRGAFDELMKIKVKDGDKETSKLFAEAVIVTSTDAVSAKTEVDPYAIGYTSLGSVNDKVKALTVDGIAPSVETVKSGEYGIARPFVLATKSPSPVAQDFLKYIVSAQGQTIVKNSGFIAEVDNASEYKASALSGKITMSGSTSVEKVMEKAKEEYCKLNPDVKIEITYSGSGAGIKDVTGGKVDIGMSSRELTEKELTELKETVFARDGIAVIVNSQNPISAMTSEQITKIFTGETRNWSKLS